MGERVTDIQRHMMHIDPGSICEQAGMQALTRGRWEIEVRHCKVKVQGSHLPEAVCWHTTTIFHRCSRVPLHTNRPSSPEQCVHGLTLTSREGRFLPLFHGQLGDLQGLLAFGVSTLVIAAVVRSIRLIVRRGATGNQGPIVVVR